MNNGNESRVAEVVVACGRVETSKECNELLIALIHDAAMGAIPPALSAKIKTAVGKVLKALDQNDNRPGSPDHIAAADALATLLDQFHRKGEG